MQIFKKIKKKKKKNSRPDETAFTESCYWVEEQWNNFLILSHKHHERVQTKNESNQFEWNANPKRFISSVGWAFSFPFSSVIQSFISLFHWNPILISLHRHHHAVTETKHKIVTIVVWTECSELSQAHFSHWFSLVSSLLSDGSMKTLRPGNGMNCGRMHDVFFVVCCFLSDCSSTFYNKLLIWRQYIYVLSFSFFDLLVSCLLLFFLWP